MSQPILGQAKPSLLSARAFLGLGTRSWNPLGERLFLDSI
jgi:hypothetical protein